ncbi:MAG: hypothetical protein GY853_03235 [PVC group bacterium]|nr:hypothetical protein [PVC group bacterium]
MKKIEIAITLMILFASGSFVCAEDVQQYAALSSSAPTQGVISNLAISRECMSLDLRDIDVKDALKYLASRANMNIVPTNDVSGRITLMIKNAPLSDIFDIVIRSNGLAYEKIGSIYNVMTDQEYVDRYGKKFDDIRQLKVFHLTYVVPEQAFAIIDSIKSNIGTVLLNSESGTIVVLDTPDIIAEIDIALQSLERKNSIQIFDLKYANAKDIAKQLKTQLDKKKAGKIRADLRTNQVVVETLPERMKDIARLIKGLDKKTKAVLIDARIIQVKLSDDLSSGVEWEGLFDVTTAGGATTYFGSTPVASMQSQVGTWRSRQTVLSDTGYIGSYPFSGTSTDYDSGTKKVLSEEMHVGVVGENDFDVLITYLKTLGKVKILSNPKLSVTNNQEARIHVGERQAYITSITTAGQTTTTVSEEVTFLDVGLQLFLTPCINDEGYVTLNIKPEISSVVGYLTTAQENKIPIIDTSTAETTVLVKDGSTVAVGGLRRDEKTINSKEVPLLGRIPFLGTLFKSEENKNKRSELLIMVTAHIVEGDELTTGRSSEFKHKLDKEYQDYQSINRESGLTEYEKEKNITIQQKMYQKYPGYDEEEELQPTIKPLR